MFKGIIKLIKIQKYTKMATNFFFFLRHENDLRQSWDK